MEAINKIDDEIESLQAVKSDARYVMETAYAWNQPGTREEAGKFLEIIDDRIEAIRRLGSLVLTGKVAFDLPEILRLPSNWFVSFPDVRWHGRKGFGRGGAELPYMFTESEMKMPQVVVTLSAAGRAVFGRAQVLIQLFGLQIGTEPNRVLLEEIRDVWKGKDSVRLPLPAIVRPAEYQGFVARLTGGGMLAEATMAVELRY